MFQPLPMHRVTIQVLHEDAPLAALTLAEYGVLHPEQLSEYQGELPELPGHHYRELYLSAHAYLGKIAAHLRIAVPPLPPGALRRVEENELRRVEDWLRQVWAKCSQCQEGLRRVEEEQRHIDQLLGILERFSALDIDLGMLQGNNRFLDVRIGSIPGTHVARLTEALQMAGFFLIPYSQREDTIEAAIAGPQDRKREIEPLLRAAGWRPIQIPPEFHDRPDQVRRELTLRRDEIIEQNTVQCRTIEDTRKEHEQRVVEAAHLLAVAAPYAEIGESLRGRGGLTALAGWVPAAQVGSLQGRLQKRLSGRVALQGRAPLREERQRVPSALRHHWLVKPFAALVKNYGIPRYGEIDPTLLFTVTFVLMFGMMFGDIGQGGVIAAAGWVYRKKLRGFAAFIVAVGLSSVVFGFLYGSLFGYEHVVTPLWMSPLSDPNLMLTIALYWGIGFIVIATVLTIRNRLAEGRIVEALLDGKGLAGLLFYLGLLYTGWYWIEHGRFGLVQWLGFGTPFAAVLAYKWRENRLPTGERVLVVFIEGFETIMAYVANTLSFLRVAAFSLNHVALAIAVFTMAGMLETAGHWITVVLGNLFILVLEGAIVAIQVLRLEYYEGFSRFYSGDGIEFRPLALQGVRP